MRITLTTQLTHKPMLTVKSLSFSYQQKQVLNDLHLVVPHAQIHGLVGMNGAGKTTLLKAISGEIKGYTGDIHWQQTPLKYADVGLLETHNFFYHYLTGRDYLQLFEYYNPQFDWQLLNELFELPLHQRIDQYSTGMKKKLALMGLLALNKTLLVLDEPFNGIDLEGSVTLSKLAEQLTAWGKTIIITSHIFESLTPICHQIHHLAEGKIVATYDKTNYHTLHDQIVEQFEHKKGNVLNQIGNKLFGGVPNDKMG